MKKEVKKVICSCLKDISEQLDFDNTGIDFSVDYTKQASHGDIATNIALVLAKKCKKSPRDLANLIKQNIEENEMFNKVEIAGPGFINFYLAPSFFHAIVKDLISGDELNYPKVGTGERVLLEFVSANPTGPLHVGHGRGAAFGSALANIYRALDYSVTCEYYLNDAGRQMEILAVSTWLRYLGLFDDSIHYPEKCYQGSYIIDIAVALKGDVGDSIFTECSPKILDNIFTQDIDDEKLLDLIIGVAKSNLSLESFTNIQSFTLNEIQSGIEKDLSGFRVEFNSWFSEKSLYENEIIDKVYSLLSEKGYLYNKDGADWFAATQWGDEKDRVFRRSNGAYTYFAADLAYHWQKFQHNYTSVIDIFGADHHGYIPRLTSGLKALGLQESIFSVLLVQFASLVRSGEKVSMSTRSGDFVTLKDLYTKVGVDSARFLYSMSKVQNHMDFDIDVAVKKSMDNPVFYVQYAYARICSVMRNFYDQGLSIDDSMIDNMDMLSHDIERSIMLLLARYFETIEKAACDKQPQLLANYLQDLASCFHKYYNSVTFIESDCSLSSVRLILLQGVAKVVKSGMSLLGVQVPERM